MATYGTISADGNTDAVWVSGPFAFRASGTWGGGTFTVSVLSADKTTWRTLNTASAMTSDATGQNLFDLPGGHYVRATLAGATAPSLAWEFFGSNVQ